ncbi:MAG TPA: T9SS type A sorting domain-containing protein [candidate division Zixibacteria bacterium]|nr:T9SS type A sorting domain-containing protein [candidate division Zixibacteria bacterium]
MSVEATVTIEDTGTYTVCVDTATDRARYCGANALEEEFCWSFVVFPSPYGAVQEGDKHTPDRLTISAVPNPFNASANIIWETTKSGEGRVEIIDLHGKVVATLHSGFISKGRHTALWNGTDNAGNPVPSGTYMCRVILGNEIATSKITLLK